jgi:protein-tyrosine phosphatase
MLDGLTKSDIASLIDYGLSAVIDLRSKAEAEAAPDAITAADGIECHVMPLIPDAAIDNSINNAPFKELYILFAERGKRKIGKIFKTMAKSRGACLFHCYAGKDRTGVIAALLLMVAGVAPDDVVADYEISGTYFRRRYTDINADSSAVLHDKVQSYPETIEYFMKHIADNYGGAGEYLKRCGVSGDEIGAILNRFLTPYPYKAVEP